MNTFLLGLVCLPVCPSPSQFVICGVTTGSPCKAWSCIFPSSIVMIAAQLGSRNRKALRPPTDELLERILPTSSTPLQVNEREKELSSPSDCHPPLVIYSMFPTMLESTLLPSSPNVHSAFCARHCRTHTTVLYPTTRLKSGASRKGGTREGRNYGEVG
jgi:hypothetical protein